MATATVTVRERLEKLDKKVNGLEEAVQQFSDAVQQAIKDESNSDKPESEKPEAQKIGSSASGK
jgi:hypothetical protein